MSPDQAIERCMQTLRTVIRVAGGDANGILLAEMAVEEFVDHVGGDTQFAIAQLERLNEQVLAVQVLDGTSADMANLIESYVIKKCFDLRDLQ